MHLVEGPELGHYRLIAKWDWKEEEKEKVQNLAGLESMTKQASAPALPLCYNNFPTFNESTQVQLRHFCSCF